MCAERNVVASSRNQTCHGNAPVCFLSASLELRVAGNNVKPFECSRGNNNGLPLNCCQAKTVCTAVSSINIIRSLCKVRDILFFFFLSAYNRI